MKSATVFILPRVFRRPLSGLIFPLDGRVQLALLCLREIACRTFRLYYMPSDGATVAGRYLYVGLGVMISPSGTQPETVGFLFLRASWPEA